eukprot:Amastigsp_a514352_14.p5 type:complete len:113 gc:universal Amastigsp_a514352_14:1792-1454(-)
MAPTCPAMLSVPMTRNLSAASLVTVRSACMRPSSESHCVYVMTPSSPSTFAVDMRLSMAPAVLPCTMNFDMKLMSITMTPLRTAACSAAQYGNHVWRPHESGPSSGFTPAGA